MNLLYRVKSHGDSWFVGNTFAVLLDDYRPDMDNGLFLGTRQCDTPLAESRKYGEIYFDEEICGFDEFEEKPFGKE